MVLNCWLLKITNLIVDGLNKCNTLCMCCWLCVWCDVCVTPHGGHDLDLQVNEKGETPLHRACIDGKLNMVKALIEGVRLLTVIWGRAVFWHGEVLSQHRETETLKHPFILLKYFLFRTIIRSLRILKLDAEYKENLHQFICLWNLREYKRRDTLNCI